MLIAKTSPVGIDYYIQELQQFLHDELLRKWKIQDAEFKSYARCSRNKTADGYIAENYIGGNNYAEVYWNNGECKVSSFFGLSSNIRRNSVEANADVHLIFFCNLDELKPSIEHRADEEVQQDVTSMFGQSLFKFQLISTETGIENVLREYPGTRRDTHLKFLDMQPVHAFRLNLKLVYNPNKNC